MDQVNPLETDTKIPAEFAELDETHVFHPGQLLRFVLLRNNQMSVAGFAKRADLPLDEVMRFVTDHSAKVTETIVLGIDRVFPGSGEIFFEFQRQYDAANESIDHVEAATSTVIS